MSEKKTRMHEVLGVETGERFKIHSFDSDYFLTADGMMCEEYKSGKIYPASGVCWESAINHGITRRPRLTEEQVKRLRALVTLEAMYLAKNKDGSVGAFMNKPTKNELYWNANDSYIFYLSIVGTCLSDLVSWSDPAPLNIMQALRQNGVGVEE